jgi:hypothetical protein
MTALQLPDRMKSNDYGWVCAEGMSAAPGKGGQICASLL